MRTIPLLLRLGLVLCVAACAADLGEPGKPAVAREGVDRHVGYYYPEPSSRETYSARAKVVAAVAKRENRLSFIVGLTQEQLQLSFAPRYAIFAKGDDAEKLIIVALDDEVFRTPYRMRAILAQMTAMARSSELFQALQVEDLFTFLDFVRMLGFTQVTVTDGDRLAHQITLE